MLCGRANSTLKRERESPHLPTARGRAESLSSIDRTYKRLSGNLLDGVVRNCVPQTDCEMTQTQDHTNQLRVLVVDDNELLRTSLAMALEVNQFRVTTAADVGEALHLIDTDDFDVLLSDLHMPGAGDGFTVVSAMRHKNPNAVTLVFTGYPALKEAMAAILLQADEILVKPMEIPVLVKLIREKSKNRDAPGGHQYGTSSLHIGTRRLSDHSRLAGASGA
jgi:ActR/RegA family two-component response regulator